MGKLKWTLRDGVLSAYADNTQLISFYLSEDFQCWKSLSDTEKQIFAYGIRQKLSDTVAGKTDMKDKIEGMKEMYGLLLDGIWEKPRSRESYKEEIQRYKAEIEKLRQELEKLKKNK